MKLPRGEWAFIDEAKLTDYCLSREHPGGRHKARVFASVLRLTAEDADSLRVALLNAARMQDALIATDDQYGQRYVIDFEMTTAYGSAIVRSTWIVLVNEDFPRLTSCFVK